MIAVLILISAAFAAAPAFYWRARLREMSFIAWVGWSLVGAGVPVLGGQVAALMLASSASEGVLTPEEIRGVQLSLAVGLAAGFGWLAMAVSTRFTGSSER